jgi:heme-degrading monooxygenase HmoA
MEMPYYAVIFSSIQTGNLEGYAEMAKKMLALAAEQDGYLGVESAHDSQLGITISYWRDLASIKQWKEDTEHSIARALGRSQWYKSFSVRIAKVERQYDF